MTKYNYDEIPTTKQAIRLFKDYSINQFRICENNMKKLEAFVIECDKRLEKFESKDKNAKI